VTFVPKLDFLSGLGYHPLRKLGAGPQYLITDLGQFDFANGRMRLVSYHPGVALKRIQKRTGFELEIAPDLQETPPPSAKELGLLRNEIDPLGIRRLELLSGASRRKKLREILAKEKEY
jgi:glutaconate CoA-transferase subunit B